jgi:hypothetical protein
MNAALLKDATDLRDKYARMCADWEESQVQHYIKRYTPDGPITRGVRARTYRP